MTRYAKSTLSLFLMATAVTTAQAAPGKMLGKGNPFQVDELPVNSLLRQRLENLPEMASQKAMRWLHGFDFPENDLDLLSIDDEGGVFYQDTHKPKPLAGATPSTTITTESILPSIDAFQLHSKPGSAKKVFLDFDGHNITGTAWNGTVSSYAARPFDTDGYPGSFSDAERKVIHEVWHRIAEDFAPFDIDVTTEQPSSFSTNTGRILFTQDVDSKGVNMPAKGAGGVAYVNVFGDINYAYYSPALVYVNTMGPNQPYFMAEAGAHEFGHNLGLSHDGLSININDSSCTTTKGYYTGMGTGNVSWAPIMGASYYANVTAWSKGEYRCANNTQDDISLIVSKLDTRNDDIGNEIATATTLAIETNGSVLATNPQNDPSNTDPVNKGIIETRSDVDVFAFDAAAGNINLTVTPAWAAFTRTDKRGANLDISTTLYDEAGNIITNDPVADTLATINTTVPAGRYYLKVSGVGNSVTPYSDYASLGEYFITGTLAYTASSNQAPIATNDSPNSISEDGTLIFPPLSNDIDPDGNALTIIAVGSPTKGVASFTANSITYKPAANYNGSDTFSYTISDGHGGTASASVTVSITAVNDAPIALNDTANVGINQTITLNVLANDSDIEGQPLSISGVSNSSKGGTITNNGSSITYKAGGSTGSDSFIYTVNDGQQGGSATGTVSINIKRR